MLKIDSLSLSYGTQEVFRNLTLEINQGEMVCLCGESGCGKSSLLKAILGFVDTKGRIEIDSTHLNNNTVDIVRRKTAYIPQDLSIPYDTVEQMATSLFELRANRNTRFSTERLFADWATLGIDHTLWQKQANEISGGQRQRIMLSVAGLSGKPLLLADEPTSALDADSAQIVAKYFRMLTQERNMTILAVSHSEQFIKECDRTITLQNNTPNIK